MKLSFTGIHKRWWT